jgi:biopolymer transport protein TolR
MWRCRPELFNGQAVSIVLECSPTPMLHWEKSAMAFSTNGTSGGDGLSSEINVTPLIDVLLVLLIIFMVIMPEMPRGLNSALPSAANRGAIGETPDRPILVEVRSSPTTALYMVNGAGVEQTELAPQLAKLLSRTSDRQVLVKAEASLDFGVIAGVIDAGQAAGAERVGLVTPQAERPSR